MVLHQLQHQDRCAWVNEHSVEEEDLLHLLRQKKIEVACSGNFSQRSKIVFDQISHFSN